MFQSKKKYIQNCTGAHLKNEKRDAKENLAGKFFAKVVFYVLLLGFLAVTGFVLFFSTYLKISKITVSGNNKLSSEEITSSIEAEQQGKFLKTIPNDNFLLAQSGKIEKSLAEKFRKIKSVSVVKKFPDTLEISLQERKALFVLCSNQQCFLIDESGIAYAEADFNSPELVQNNLIEISDKSSRDIKLGEKVVRQGYIEYVSKLKESLQRLDITVENEFQTFSLMAEEIDVRTTRGWDLYFSTQFPLESAIGALKLVLDKEPLKTQQDNVIYIDLRTENKVFYKLNNQPSSTESTENQDAVKNK